MWYKTGTINLTANSPTVTGTGTAWADAKFGVMPGMILLAPDNKLYEIKQVNSNTSLALNSNYAGATVSGQAYAIITTYEGDISQFSARFAAMLTFFQGSRNDTVTWFTGTEDMTFTKDDGTKLTVPTLAKIQADYVSKTSTTEQNIAGAVKFSKTPTFNNGLVSIGNATLRSVTAGANVVLRYRDYDGVEQGALYSTPTNGEMTLRWGGTTHSLQLKQDGTSTFPSDIYIGNAKVSTQAISLSSQDLDNIKTEGDFYQSLNANATVDNHYPNAQAGYLRVLVSRAGVSGRVYITQLYYPYKAGDYYYQRMYDASIGTWSLWDIYRGQSYNDGRYAPAQGGGKIFADVATFKAWLRSSNGLMPFRLSTPLTGYSPYHSSLVWNTGDTYAMLMPYYNSPEIKCITGNTVGTQYQEFFLWTTGNTTVDSNGFIKKASPIARLSSNPEKMTDEYLNGFTLSGLAAINSEAAGVIAEHVSVGVYKVSGSLGFAQEGWNIEVPQDANGNRLCFVATEVAEDGTIMVKVSKRRFDIDTAAIVAGEPMDIPEGRWIDLRLEMPPLAEDSNADIEEPAPESHEGEMMAE